VPPARICRRGACCQPAAYATRAPNIDVCLSRLAAVHACGLARRPDEVAGVERRSACVKSQPSKHHPAPPATTHACGRLARRPDARRRHRTAVCLRTRTARLVYLEHFTALACTVSAGLGTFCHVLVSRELFALKSALFAGLDAGFADDVRLWAVTRNHLSSG